eukprot:COSAG06_NODE_824_length_12073_cov_102.305161_7_plen_79_part_00
MTVAAEAGSHILQLQLQTKVCDCPAPRFRVVACPLTGREIDVESQKALRKVKHSCSEVIRALALRFGEHSGIDRKISA